MSGSVRLGLAAAASAIAVIPAGVWAADLPLKAKPVEYVKVCSLYGAGFYYIPGTDICIKVGGFVRTQAEVNSGYNGVVNGSGFLVGNGLLNRAVADSTHNVIATANCPSSDKLRQMAV